MAARGKLLGLFLQLTAVLLVVPGKQGLDLRCLRTCNVKGDLTCLAKCAAERSRRDADDYPQSGPCDPWPFEGLNLPWVPASPTDLRVAGRINGTCTVNGVDRRCEGVTVEWRAAAQGLRELRGFQASILRPDHQDNNCYQVIIPQSVEADGETIYNHTFFPIFEGGNYVVSVYSLPMNYDTPEEAPPARITVTPRSCTELYADDLSFCGPEAWIPKNINITVAGRSVDVNFPVAQHDYGVLQYHIFISNMKCNKSDFNCETWREKCDGLVATLPGGPYRLVPKPTDSQVVQLHYDEIPPRKYLFEVRGDFRQRTCPTVFEVTDWAPPVDSLAITEDMWTCTADVLFPAGDGVPSYRVCMDDACVSVTHDSGPSVSHTFQPVQPYHEYQVKVSDDRYTDATNTVKSFTSLQGNWTPNITDLVTTDSDDGFFINLTFMSPQCIQQYIVNVCINGEVLCLHGTYDTKPSNKGFPWVTLDLPVDMIRQGSWQFRVKAADMPGAPEGFFTIDLPLGSTTRPTPPPPPPPTTPDSGPSVTSPVSRDESWRHGAAAAGGVVAAVVLIIILVCCWKHPRRPQIPKICGDTDNNLQPTEGRYLPSVQTLTDSLPDIRQKTVLLLASYDCVEHRTVVLCFAAYLQRECHCQVILDLHKTEDISKLGAMEWLVSHIHGVDYVIVICSAGTKFKATKGDKKSCHLQEIEPSGDLFTGGLKHINLLLHSRDEDMSKFINVYFPYSRKTDVPATLEIARTFKLMESMPALFCHIHGHSQFSMEGAVHIDVAEQVGSTESGRKLLSAIAKMEAKDKAEPNWFISRIVSTSERDNGNSSHSKANSNGKVETNPTDKGEETSAKTPADVNVMVEDEAKVCPDDVDDEGYCHSIPMNLLNNGTIQYDPFLPQPDAQLYREPEPYVYRDMMVQPAGPPYQSEPVQFPLYGHQQDQVGWQSPYGDMINNQQVYMEHVTPMEQPHRPNLKLHIPEPPQGQYVPKEPSKEAITPESGCYSGENIEDQLSFFNLQSQAAFSELQV
ncbi:PREDICTED: uncharacterized protein LOC109470052 [Branchiostoma belcheri]|uniref:Uncharacterized protein LOC109470052 n=1 Tax=Branchiostoma belcheri TaxID=7741 RepID=A0A6P4YZY8_BRABE|nr:PREDICTED: uncharacterized protein LOC109470052 [Branchiostoma belcheri]